MEVYCTRPSCKIPENTIPDEILESRCATCSNCGMPLILQGHFVALELLGEGGFGRTFKAIDLDFPFTNRVIKQLHYANPHGRVLTPEQRQSIQKKFTEEAITLDKLNHPRIPRLLAFFNMEIEELTGSFQRFFYLVQDYIEGQNLAQDLEQKLRHNQTFSESEVINVLREVLNILQYIHNDECTNKFICIHRDIKPENIMRCSVDGKLYLIDFGAVKQILQGFEVETTSIVLDPRFAPPEQFHGQRLSPASDLYATAATCVYLLTGNRNPNEFLQESSLSNIVMLKDPHFAKALDMMLQHKSKDRPQSAQEVLDILSGKHEEVTQIPNQAKPSWLKRFFNWVRQIFRRWRWLRFGFFALLGLAIAFVFYPRLNQNPVANAQYFSRGEDVLIPRNQQANPECQTAYDFKDKGVDAFKNHDFSAAEIHFKEAMQQFKQAAQNTTSSENKCEVDPETLIYQYNSQVAQIPSNLSLPTIAVVIPGKPELNYIALEILRGVAQALNVRQPLFQILIANENIGSNKTETVAKYISKNNIPGDSYFKSKILGVIGHYTTKNTWKAGDIYGSADINNTDKLVLISPTSTGNRTHDLVNDNNNLNPYVFRTASNDEIAAGDLAEYMSNKLELQRALISYDSTSTDYSTSMLKGFRNKIIDPNNNTRNCDFRTEKIEDCIRIAKNIKPRALIFFPSPSALYRAINNILAINNIIELKDQNFKVLAGDVLYDRKTLNLKQSADGMIIAVFSHMDKANKQFIDKATKIGWKRGDMTWRSISSYDAAQVFVKALTDSSDNSTKTRQGIYSKLKDDSFSASGATTDIGFEKNGDRKLVTGVGVLVQVAQTNPNSDEYEFKLLETPQRNKSETKI
jgi:serine/threonine protein kinase